MAQNESRFGGEFRWRSVLISIIPPLKLLSVVSLFLLLQGCIGIGYWAIGDHTSTSPVQDLTISKTKGVFGITDKPNGQVINSDFLLRYWGVPDDREQISKGSEIWEYRVGNLRWHGMVLDVLFIPIPFLVPFGYDYVTLVIQDGQVKSAARTGSDTTFSFFCGYVVVMHNKGPWICEYETK